MASRWKAQDSIPYGSLGLPVERAQAAPEKASSGSAPSPVVTEASSAGAAPTSDPGTSSTTNG